MIKYYTPLYTSIKTLLGYKTGHLLGAATISAISIETIISILELDFLGIPIILTGIVILFTLFDWVLGTAASIKLSNDAKKDGNYALAKEKEFKSTKIGYTFFKIFSLYLWLLLSFTINKKLKGIYIINDLKDIFTIIPIFLFGFREFISIGEDIDILYGKKPYLFTLGEKIFNILEFKFLHKLKK